MEFVDKHINIREDQDEWVSENHIQLSSWVRSKLDEEIDQ